MNDVAFDKMMKDNTVKAFLALVRAGLWEQDVRLLPCEDIEWHEVYRLATEQSVLGLVLAGLEHTDVKPPQLLLLQWIGEVQMIEQRNKAMNGFVAELIDRLRKEDVYCVLVKGQGVAQCYEKPMWRASGDIDLLLSGDNYQKAKDFLIPLASNVEKEDLNLMHLGMTISSWEVELHGTLRSGLWKKLDGVIDEAMNEVFYSGSVRSWRNGNTQVFLPRADEDAVFIFFHILQHFYLEGVGLRQLCDWCRLITVYNSTINCNLLESRLKRAGVLSEWCAFAYLAVNTLGMPADAMPLYNSSVIWKKKANRVLDFILETGNLGHNREHFNDHKVSFVKRKFLILDHITQDFCKYIRIFPKSAVKVWFHMITVGLSGLVRKQS